MSPQMTMHVSWIRAGCAGLAVWCSAAALADGMVPETSVVIVHEADGEAAVCDQYRQQAGPVARDPRRRPRRPGHLAVRHSAAVTGGARQASAGAVHPAIGRAA